METEQNLTEVLLRKLQQELSKYLLKTFPVQVVCIKGTEWIVVLSVIWEKYLGIIRLISFIIIS